LTFTDFKIFILNLTNLRKKIKPLIKKSTFMQTKRLFLAIPLAKEHLHDLQKICLAQPKLPNVRWVPEANLHITVYFFGNVANSQIPNLINQISQSCEQIQVFNIEFSHVQTSPKRNPYMLWSVYKPNNQFNEAYFSICQNTHSRAQVPPTIHVTLARFKAGDQQVSFQLSVPIATTKIHVERMILFESELHPNGSKYSKIQSFILKQN